MWDGDESLVCADWCFRIYFSKDWRTLQVAPISPLEISSGWEIEDLGIHFKIYTLKFTFKIFKYQQKYLNSKHKTFKWKWLRKQNNGSTLQ